MPHMSATPPATPSAGPEVPISCCPQAQQSPKGNRGRFCVFCGTATGLADAELEPAVIPPDPDPTRDWDARAEHALAKALSDMWDGHLGLWGSTDNFRPDRLVSGLHGRDWIGELLRRGWVQRQAKDVRQLHVAPSGLEVVRAFRAVREPQAAQWPLPPAAPQPPTG